MTKFVNPGLTATSRRNVLRGSVLAGAAAMTGSLASASASRQPSPPPRNILPDAQVLRVQQSQMKAAAPAGPVRSGTRKAKAGAPSICPAT